MYNVHLINVKNKNEERENENSPKVKNYFKSHFYEEGKVFIVLAKIIGALPISKNKNGEIEFKILSAITIYSFLLLTILAICNGFLIRIQINTLQTYDISFDDRIILYAALFYLGIYILPLISFFEGNKIAKYFTLWLNFEQKYFDYTKKRLNYKMKNLQYITLFIFFLDSMFSLYFLYFMIILEHEKYTTNVSTGTRTLTIIIYFYYLWIINSFLGTWIFLTLGIRKTARILLNDLQDTRLRTYFFDELYALWLDLKYLTGDLGTAFSWSYIYYLTYMFMMMMGASYASFISLATPGADTNIIFLGSFLLTTAFFGLIADSAHRTTLQVGDAFANVLLQLMTQEKDPVRKRDMKWFVQTLALNPPVLTLSGYFTLNRELNVSMLGTLVTYIVVVLQFRANSAVKTKD